MRIVLALAALAAAQLAGTACTADAPGQANPNCTQALYDPCNDEHDCDSALCRGFDEITPMCTIACTVGGTPCPDQSGTAVACDGSGFCRADAPRDCMIVF